ncbi:phage tail protein, partial [Actinomadura adrarensis]
DVPGTLTVEAPDGSRRSIAAFYNGGLDGEEDPMDDLMLCSQVFPRLEFLALDPYWTGGTVSDQWKADAGTPWFGPLPLRLSPSQVLGNVTVDLPGDADAYPVWTITGPGVPIIQNVTTGRGFEFRGDAPIDAGRTVTIDTRPDRLTVLDDLGNDLYASLEPFPDMWSLEPGANELQVELTGSTPDSQAAFSADVRWQAGW